jgi:hypothetical protein
MGSGTQFGKMQVHKITRGCHCHKCDHCVSVFFSPQVIKVPSLVAVVPAPLGSMTSEQKAALPPGQTPLSIQPYVGPLKFQSMKVWLEAMAMLTGKQRGQGGWDQG